MKHLALVGLRRDHVPVIDRWLADPGSRMAGAIPFDRCFEYQSTAPRTYNWVACDGQDPVVWGGFEINDCGEAWLALLTRPDRRGQGYGRAVARLLVATPEIAPARRIMCSAEKVDVAAQRCLAAAGLVLTGTDPTWPEFDDYEYPRTQSGVDTTASPQ